MAPGKKTDAAAHIYVNAADLEFTAYDIAIELRLATSKGDGRPPITVHLSPEFGLVLTSLLMSNMAMYEKRAGAPIPIAPDLVKRMRLEPALKLIRQMPAAIPDEARKP